AIDGRSAVGKALAAWRRDLVADLGGLDRLSTQRAAIVDLCVREKLLIDSVDTTCLSWAAGSSTGRSARFSRSSASGRPSPTASPGGSCPPPSNPAPPSPPPWRPICPSAPPETVSRPPNRHPIRPTLSPKREPGGRTAPARSVQSSRRSLIAN